MDGQAWKWLVDKAIQSESFEACGFILEDGTIIEMENISSTPTRSFRMDRNELTEKLDGIEAFITAIWHTHPRGTQHPSHTDLNSIKMGAIQRNWRYLIVTSAGVFEYDTGLYAPQDISFWESFSQGKGVKT